VVAGESAATKRALWVVRDFTGTSKRQQEPKAREVRGSPAKPLAEIAENGSTAPARPIGNWSSRHSGERLRSNSCASAERHLSKTATPFGPTSFAISVQTGDFAVIGIPGPGRSAISML
jgi:hypothetical protein